MIRLFTFLAAAVVTAAIMLAPKIVQTDQCPMAQLATSLLSNDGAAMFQPTTDVVVLTLGNAALIAGDNYMYIATSPGHEVASIYTNNANIGTTAASLGGEQHGTAEVATIILGENVTVAAYGNNDAVKTTSMTASASAVNDNATDYIRGTFNGASPGDLFVANNAAAKTPVTCILPNFTASVGFTAIDNDDVMGFDGDGTGHGHGSSTIC